MEQYFKYIDPQGNEISLSDVPGAGIHIRTETGVYLFLESRIANGQLQFRINGDAAWSPIGGGIPVEPPQTESFTVSEVWDGGTQRGYMYVPAEPTDRGIICYHGNGENGTDPAALLAATIPLLISAGLSFNSYIFCPQANAQWEAPAALQAANWFKANFPINPGTLYGVGASAGARVVVETEIANPGTFAAAFLCGLATNSINANAAAIKNFPIYIVHGMLDAVVDVANPCGNVDAILSQNPTIPPKIRTVGAGIHDSTTWNPNGFDYREAGFNFETDFLYLHSLNAQQQATNYVARVENRTEKDITGYLWYLEAKRVVDTLPAGSGKDMLVTRLGAVLSTLQTDQQIVMIDLGQSAYAHPNKISTQAVGASGALKDISGATTSLTFEQVFNQWAGELDACPAGAYFGLPNYRDGFRIEGTTNQWKLNGLTGVADIGIFYSLKRTVNTSLPSMSLTVAGQTVTCTDISYNTTQFAEFKDAANTGGSILMELKSTSGQYSIINTIIAILK